ncbi:demethylmenaquinone methyltransferase [Streptoalloteichus hindustanus]|uniref:Demethylmenaquinone methyltransferase n=1 Tax=Streptoalloteichus hindustanus TaxID=2017 RepID=A0A1M4TRF6_STRHI|nr:demethylmenaquinone methyltransferase [Streptoalloteichus hindustanus]SHE46877.1 demethylmenaquinone methyltransferase / 2-methoxy-6-polyprenyl-1,4-benzoquinol methylase [Streptoalloteichus hindustanus]
MVRADLDKDPRAVAEMFDGVARRYDLANTVISFGQDRRWRTKTSRAVDPQPGERVLDLAAGTAVSTVELASSGAWCVAADFSLGMLERGRHRGVPLVAADALRLPFADESFDAVTISFGLRNVVDTEAALREMARVTRPGGRIVVCEFSRPTWQPFRWSYELYLRIVPWVAGRVSSNPEAYRYLTESISEWPAQRQLAEIIHAAGWRDVAWRNLMGGAVALHRAVKPEATAGAEGGAPPASAEDSGDSGDSAAAGRPDQSAAE